VLDGEVISGGWPRGAPRQASPACSGGWVARAGRQPARVKCPMALVAYDLLESGRRRPSAPTRLQAALGTLWGGAAVAVDQGDSSERQPLRILRRACPGVLGELKCSVAAPARLGPKG